MLRKIGTVLAITALLLPWRTTGNMIFRIEWNLLTWVQYLFQSNIVVALIIALFVVGILVSLKYPFGFALALLSLIYVGYEAVSSALTAREAPLSFIGYGYYLALISTAIYFIGLIMEAKSVVTVTERT